MAKCHDCGKEFPERPVPVLFQGLKLDGFNALCDKCMEKERKADLRERADELEERRRKAQEEREQRLVKARADAVGGARPLTDWTFKSYDPKLNPEYQKWYAHILEFPLESKNLFVYGPTGTGKSHLCTAKIKTLWEKTPPGKIVRFPAKSALSLVKINKYGQPNNFYERNQAIRDLALKTDALFIDELDKVTEMSATREYQETLGIIREILTMREEANKFGLILASNYDQSSIAATYGVPVADRISMVRDFDIWEIPQDTPSYRSLIEK